jgi:hypothetical protein
MTGNGLVDPGQACSGSYRFLQTAFIEVMTALHPSTGIHQATFRWEHILPTPLAVGMGIFAL